uniref:C2H2-type domain-containing protein n=1 Tax=Falco tinnunculus TaxID=100819 RepID=A0A8C4TVQ3_FALTI
MVSFHAHISAFQMFFASLFYTCYSLCVYIYMHTHTCAWNCIYMLYILVPGIEGYNFYWVLMINAFFSRGLPPPQQQQMLSLRATNQPSLLNANPMLQRALLMQQMQGTVVMGDAVVICCVFAFTGNLRGFNMTAPALQQFFPQATRHSLLGPPPVGVSLKPTRLGFPGLPFQRQNRTFRKVDPGSSSQAQGDEKVEIPEGMQAGSEQNNSLPSTGKGEACHGANASRHYKLLLAIPAAKIGDYFSLSHLYFSLGLNLDSFFQQVLSSGGSLKVTIQQSSESRAISTTALKPGHWTCEVGTADPNPESVLKFYCYICKTNCCSQQNFQSHMAGIQHQQRLGEIQHMSNVCFVSLLPMVKEGEDKPEPQRWCNTCQIHFTGDLIKHRRTQEHKLAKRALRPFCTVCSRHFKTPRKFVEHMKSPEHKQKAKELGSPEDSEELITVDAVGCFEDDDDEEEEEEGGAGEEEDLDVVLTENEDSATKQVCLDFLVPVAGYLCRLCHKFYHSDSAARLAHCKSLMHFENFQVRPFGSHTDFVLCLHPKPALTNAKKTPPPPQPPKTLCFPSSLQTGYLFPVNCLQQGVGCCRSQRLEQWIWNCK